MKSIKTTIQGIRPLILTNPQTVQLSNKYAVRSRDLNSKLKAALKKEDADKLLELEQNLMRNDWESSVYWDDANKQFYLPDTCLLACVRAGASAAKKGKDIDRAVLVSETELPIETVKHNTLDAYWEDPAFRLSGPCKVPPKTGALIWKCRCMIPTGWKITFTLEYDDGIVAEKSLRDAIENAGRLIGLGGWRPKFGRFIVENGPALQ